MESLNFPEKMASNIFQIGGAHYPNEFTDIGDYYNCKQLRSLKTKLTCFSLLKLSRV